MISRSFISAFILLVSFVSVGANTLKWEEINPSVANTLPRSIYENIDTNEEKGLEVFVYDGFIYIITDHETQVRIISILGQPIVDSRLKPGAYRMSVKSRGIYIVKAGMATLRVTL